MIYLDHTTTAQDTLIPSNGLTEGFAQARFILRSTVSGIAVYTQDISAQTDGAYYRVIITLPGTVQAGEYIYTLHTADGRTVASGLCQIGNYRRTIINDGDGGLHLKQAR